MPIIHSPTDLSMLVKNQRKKLKLSQTEVGELVGLKQKTISAIENTPQGVLTFTYHNDWLNQPGARPLSLSSRNKN